MWKKKASLNMALLFNALFHKRHQLASTSELQNLSKLFSNSVLSGIEAILSLALTKGSKASVDIAWIDKRPIAYWSKKHPGAELGDMMIVSHYYQPNGAYKNSRACLLEVKQSKTMDVPPVPVTRGKSTLNQLHILTLWPKLLYLRMTGSHKSSLMKNIDLQSSSTADELLSQAWYVAVKPKSHPHRWVAAPAIAGAPFRYTLGEIIAACLQGESLPKFPAVSRYKVGRDFIGKPDFATNPNPEWADLICGIAFTAHEYALPQSHFGKSAGKRLVRGRVVTGTAALGISLPFVTDPVAADTLTYIACVCLAFGIGLSTYLLDRHRERQRFPVLFFHIQQGEE